MKKQNPMKAKSKTMAKKIPRGIRNNNPLNIRRSRLKWNHEIFREPMDKSFCQFDEMKYGWRAAFCLLRRYITVYGANTIEKIIRRWAPSTENNTQAYIEMVSKLANKAPDAPIDFLTIEILQVAAAMCRVENGEFYYPMKKWNRTLLLAMCEGLDMCVQDTFSDSQEEAAIKAAIEEINRLYEEKMTLFRSC